MSTGRGVAGAGGGDVTMHGEGEGSLCMAGGVGLCRNVGQQGAGGMRAWEGDELSRLGLALARACGRKQPTGLGFAWICSWARVTVGHKWA